MQTFLSLEKIIAQIVPHTQCFKNVLIILDDFMAIVSQLSYSNTCYQTDTQNLCQLSEYQLNELKGIEMISIASKSVRNVHAWIVFWQTFDIANYF